MSNYCNYSNARQSLFLMDISIMSLVQMSINQQSKYEKSSVFVCMFQILLSQLW